MAINKVVYGTDTLIDLSPTTATADSVLSGYGCFGADGEWIDGTATSGGGGIVNLAYTTKYPAQTESTSGLTIVYNDDGSFTVSGKLSSSYAYTIPFDRIRVLAVGKTYTLAMYSDNVDCDAYLYFDGGTATLTGANPSSLNVSTAKSPVTFSVTGGTYTYNHITVMFRTDYNGGDYGDGTTIRIMLEEGAESHPWVSPWAYGGSGGSSGTMKLQSKTVEPTESKQDIFPDDGYDGLSKVSISAIDSMYVGSNVPTQSSKVITPTKSAQIAVSSGVYATGDVTVNAIPEEYVITTDATAEASDIADGKTAYVNGIKLLGTAVFGGGEEYVPPTLQDKTATPTEAEQIITADSQYDGLNSVAIKPIATDYVGSGVPRKSSADGSVSGATVNFPAGYYPSAASKAVPSGSVTVSKPTVSSNGLVTASATVSAGYVSGNPSSNTLQLTTKAAATITPSTSQQTAIPSGTYATGNIVVSAVPTETKTVTENGIYTPATGKFFSSVTVNLPIQKYYTGNSVPSSSVGDDNDIFLMG